MTPSLKRELWRTPDLLGFAAHWTWIWCLFWSSLFYGEGKILGLAESAYDSQIVAVFSLEPLWVASLLANVLAIAVLLALSHFRNPLADMRFLPQLAGSLTMVGTFALSHDVLALAGKAAPTVYLIGSLLTGVGSGIIVVLWAELLASLGPKRTVHYSVGALLFAALAYLLIRLLPNDVAQLLVATLPCVSMGFFLHFKRSMPRLSRRDRNVRVKEQPPVRMIAVATFFGLSFGIMKGLIAPVGDDWMSYAICSTSWLSWEARLPFSSP